MKRFPQSSPGNITVFTSCLLSFLILITPIATVSAARESARGASTQPAEAKTSAPVTTVEPPIAASLTASMLAPVAVGPITATKADSFPDADGDGKAELGETITYTVGINNTGTDDATGVSFNDTIDANTTFVPGSMHASPIAFNDTYNWVGNTVLDTSARALPSATANDVAVTDSFVVVTQTNAATTQGGLVTLASNGHFVYTPQAGDGGAGFADTFTYTIRNSTDASLVGTGTVTINMPTRVWYLDGGSAGGDGRSHNPSNSPALMSTAADQSTDVFYVFSDGNTLNGPFTLETSQQLLGQGVALNLSGFGALFLAGSVPTIASSAGGNAVTLGSNNTLAGFNIGTTSGTAISGSNVGTLNVNIGTINTTGAGLDLTGVGSPTVSISLTSLTSSGGTKNVNLVGLNGTIALGTGALSGTTAGATNHAFAVSGGTAGITYLGSITKATTGNVVNIASRTGGTITLSGTINGSSSSGINASDNTGGTINFSGGTKTLNTAANAAVTLATNPGATINFSNGGLDIDTTSGTGFTATGGGTVTVTGTINTIDSTTGTALNVANTNIGASGLTFRSINSPNSSANNGVILNTTGTTAGTHGGLTITGNGGTCTSAATCTGGNIANKTGGDGAQALNGTGIYLNNTRDVSLTNVFLNDFQNYAIYGSNVTNFTFTTSRVSGTNGTSSNPTNEGCIRFDGLLGNALITGSNIGNTNTTTGATNTLHVNNASGTLTLLDIQNSTIFNQNTNNTPANIGQDAIFFGSPSGATGTMNLRLNNSTLSYARQFLLQVNINGTQTANIEVTNNTFHNLITHVVNAGGGSNITGGGTNVYVKYLISGNSFRHSPNLAPLPDGGNPGRSMTIGHAAGSATFDGKFLNNTIGQTGVVKSGAGDAADGLGIFASGNNGTNGTSKALIQGNTIQRWGEAGIYVNARQGSSTLDVTILGNIIREPGTAALGAFAAIWVNSGALPPDTNIVNVVIGSATVAADKNTMTNADPSNATDVFLDKNTCGGCASQLRLYQNGSDAAGATTEDKVRDVINDDNIGPLDLLTGFTNASAITLVPGGLPAQPTAMYMPENTNQRDYLARSDDSPRFGKQVRPTPDATDSQSRNETFTARSDHKTSKAAITRATQSVTFNFPGLQLLKSGNRRFTSAAEVTSSAKPEKARGEMLLAHGRTSTARSKKSGKTRTATASTLTPLAPMPPLTPLTIGTLPGNKSVTIKFQVTVNTTGLGSATSVSNQGSVSSNIATVSTDDPSVVGASNPTVTDIARLDLSMTKTDGVTTITPGSDLTYTLSYSNLGHAANGVTLTETVPVGTTFKATGSTATWSCADGSAAGTTCTLSLGNLPRTGQAGATGTATFIVTVVNPAAAGLGSIQNTASIAHDGSYEPDINPANNTATDINTTLNAAPDLRIVDKTDGVATTTPGSTLTYTITYENYGNQNATGVVLTETVPVGTTFKAAGSSAWVGCANGAAAGTVCTISVGALNAGAAPGTATFVVVVDSTIVAGQTHVNNIVSIADDTTNGADGTNNNSLTDSDVLNAAPDLTISKTPDAANAAPGQTITYTLNYSNIGNQGAAGVVITETVPVDTTFDSAASAPTVWSCANNSAAGTSCTTTIGALAGGGANGTAKFAVKVIASPVGTTISNTATIADNGANGADTDTTNNTTGNVNTSLDTPPTLGTYSDKTMLVTETSTVTPSAAPADDKPGFTVAASISPNTFTGTVSVPDQTTGVVSISSAAPAGTYTVTVTATDSIGQTATKTFQLTVNKSGTTTALASSMNPSFINQNITFTATVASSTAVTGPPTGSVDFFDGATLICDDAPLNGAGVATCSTSTLDVAGSPHSITATYNGDATFNTSTSSALSQTISPSLNLTVNDGGDASDLTLDGICDTDAGTAGDQCTLRAAIQETNNAPSADSIGFSGVSVVMLMSTLPDITGDLTINGPGPKASNLVIKGNDTFTLMNITGAGVDVTINTLSFEDGAVSGGKNAAAIEFNNAGILTVNDSEFYGGSSGQVIYSNAATRITLNRSSIRNNVTLAVIFVDQTPLDVINSTISNNTGRAIENTNTTLSVTNSTIADNDGGILNHSGSLATSATLINTLLSNNGNVNLAKSGAQPNTFTSNGHNLIDDATHTLLAAPGPGDLLGTSIIAGLAALADNGGPTQTRALLSNSAALDAGDNAVTGAPLNLTTDQRGGTFARSVDSADIDLTAIPDIGAFEAQPSIEDIGAQSTAEDTALSDVTFRLGDVDPSTDTVAGVSSDQTLVKDTNIVITADTNSTRKFSITPEANKFGTVTITLTVTGNSGQTMSDSFTLTIGPVADGVSVTDTTTPEDTMTAAGQLIVTPAPLDAGSTTHFRITSILNGTLFKSDTTTPVSSGDFISVAEGAAGLRFQPAPDSNATGNFIVQGATGNVAGSEAGATDTANITVTAVNDAPSFQIASNPPAVNEDASAQTVAGFATNFLPGPATATDEAGQTLVGYTVTQTGTTGNLTFTSGPSINNAGTLTYTPTGNTSGTATFNVVATDSGSGTAPNVNQSATVAFTITVTGKNDAPVLDNTGNMTLTAISEDVPLASNLGTLVSGIISSAGGDRITDVDAGSIEGIAVTSVDNTNGVWQYTIDGGTSWTAFGTPDALNARLLASNALTRVRFIPNADFNGTVDPGVTFRAWDQSSGTNGNTADASIGGGITAFSTATETAGITVTEVNDAPTASNDTIADVGEDSGPRTIAFTTLTVNDSKGPANEVGQTLTINNVSNPVGGTVSIVGSDVIFTPTAGYNGPASFQYTVTDNGTTNGVATALQSAAAATVSFTINAVNDAPVNTVPGAQTVNENGSLTFNAANSNLISIADIDAGANAVQVILTATNAKITLSSTAGLTFTPANANNDGTDDATLSFTGTIANINAALIGLVFAPSNGYDGPASIQIVTNDQGNTGSGGALSDTDTINVMVLQGGTLVFDSATYTVAEDGGSATITVNRAGGSNGTTKVDYTTSNGTATAGQDYTTTSGQLTFNNGVTTQTFSVPINNDALDEANETINLTLSNVTGSGDLGVPSTAVLTITDNDPQPTLSINDVTLTESNSGTVNAVFTVTLSAQSGQLVTVNYATANDTATAPSDYQAIVSTLLTFNPGETQKNITIVVNGDTASEPDESFFVNLSGATNATTTDNQGVGAIITDDLPVMQFNSATYTVGEAAGHTTITVTRVGNLAIPASVDYTTSDLSGLTNCNITTGNASQRCDYTAIAGTLSFPAGQSVAAFEIPIINDVYVEGPETLSLTLSNPTGGIMGTPTTATLTITDNDNSPGAPNPIDDPAFFVALQYMDILNRSPEGQGLADWLAIIQNCPVGDTTCDLVEVSSGFFRSKEFFDRAYYIYRFYEVGLGRKPNYDEYQRDLRLVTGFLTNAELEQRKQQFAIDFSQRADFKALYDQYDSQTRSQEYVDALSQMAGVTLGNRQTLASNLVNSHMQRWDVLRAIVEGPEVSAKFFNKAFVVIGYFAYLRRDPDALYLVWLAQMDNPPAGKTQREVYRDMIAGFIFSPEYRHRFGP